MGGELLRQIQRVRVTIRGAVQGVGFRPFVYRLATELDLKGWVNNSPQGVFVEAEGSQEALERFLLRLPQEKPPRASIQSLESSFLDPVGYTGFEIRQSDGSGSKTALVLPDIATCADCLREILDPADRRYRYPFTNCTNCGPRYSIVEALPYDRANTTMRCFPMCDECRAEYENPLNRRFHAEPIACPNCGPHLELWDRSGRVLASRESALLQAAQAIREGSIIAVKGLGGFQFMADARSADAIARLRERKHREEKPFALMYPSLDLIRTHCALSELEERLLRSPEAPIVLLQKTPAAHELASNVAPGNPYLGVMLPYTPLHHVLMLELGFPVVATSGNLSDEPICIDERDALERLGGIADLFLVHNRPIARHVDDSIVRVMMGRELVQRRARGYAPLPVSLKEATPPLIAVGAHLKNAVAISADQHVFVSQHIGDLETTQAFDAFRDVIGSLSKLYDHQPDAIACDAHPDYRSTQYARELAEKSPRSVVSVQHHYAHALSCMAENELDAPVMAVSWDGTGYGLDGTVWGGEFLHIDERAFTRAAHLRTFRLPGGDKAVKEPRRVALGLLYELYGDDLFANKELQKDLQPLRSFSTNELGIIGWMLSSGTNAPVTSSAGRLFDAVAAIIGLRQKASFEGQAAMMLEFALDGVKTDDCYVFQITRAAESGESGESSIMADLPASIDWAPMIHGILDDLRCKVPLRDIAAKFHNTLVEIIVTIASRVGEERIVLTGGCFQNKYLTERTVQRLRAEKFRPYWHQRIPPNDGGIALGQVVAAARGRDRG